MAYSQRVAVVTEDGQSKEGAEWVDDVEAIKVDQGYLWLVASDETVLAVYSPGEWLRAARVPKKN